MTARGRLAAAGASGLLLASLTPARTRAEPPVASSAEASPEAATPRPADTATPPPPEAAATEQRVTLTVVGDREALSRVQSLLASHALGGTLLSFERVERFNPSEMLSTPSAGPRAALRCWVDLSEPREARLYFAAGSGEQFLIREVALSPRFDDLDRESLAQILELSIKALLENERAGLTRDETRALLGTREREPPRDVATAPARSLPGPHAPSTASLLPFFGVSYALQAVSRDHPVVHGPGLRAGLASDHGRVALGAWLGARYLLPETERAATVGVRLQTIATRAGLVVAWPLEAEGRATASERRHAAFELGLGVDFVRVSPEPGNETASVELVSPHWSEVFVATGGLGADLLSGPAGELVARAYADWLPIAVHYDVRDSETTSRVFSPWRLRPGLALEFAFR